MADLPDLMTNGMTNLLNFLPAAAGLGTAAMGLVDSSKVFGGGPSNFGFGYIEQGLKDFIVPPALQATAFGEAAMMQTLLANWLNGMAKADQKSVARALIHLQLTEGSAPTLAKAAGVDGGLLASLALKVRTGDAPTAQEVNVLGQFDVVLSAVLDAAYERGDQKYRNACKILASLVAAILAVIAGKMLYGADFGRGKFFLSLLVGLSATPLAPIAKDLASSLQTAAAAIKTVKR